MTCGPEGGDEITAALQRVGGLLVLRRGVGELRMVGQIERVAGGPDLAQEGEAALERTRRFELVGEHGRDAESVTLPGMAVEHVQ